MSNFTTISCESCGAELSLPKGDTSITCGFCDTLNKPDLENLKPQNKTKVMMFNAVESDNWEEVGKYATQLLEDDPSDYESWFYKGASAGWVSRHIDDPSKQAAELVSKNKIIGWFQGRMEFGPRALGNRSILANPMNPDMKEIVNSRIKFKNC